MNIGCHLSTTKGYYKMGEEALSIDANTFQFFTRNPRGGKAKAIDERDINKLKDLMKENNFSKILAHAPYTLNPCSSKEETREFALEMMEDDLRRMEYLPNQLYNFHPGSHTGQGMEVGINQIIELLNKVMKEEQTTTVLLETMAGKGTEVGSRFEELAQIISEVTLKDKIGVCLDTCHVHDAGYDIVNDLDGVLEEFDKIIGLDKLKAIHLNDTMNVRGAHKDRHEKIGKGEIGLEAIKKIVTHPKLKDLPFFLETPNEIDGYKEEIALLRSFTDKQNTQMD